MSNDSYNNRFCDDRGKHFFENSKECEFLGLKMFETRKTKESHPYNYDPLIIWGRPNSQTNFEPFSNKIQEIDPTKYKTLLDKHELKNWTDSKKTESFFKEFYGANKVTLFTIVEYCDNNGYPYYRFSIRIE